MKPRLLDLFCGAGGAAMGYHRAGFDVVGVDINPQPHYPFEFVRGDALAALDWLNDMAPVDVIHASPPCQAHSMLRHVTGGSYPDMIDAVRERLWLAGLPYVIENVVGAPLFDPMTLCGSMFGLGVRRHRLFESSMMLMPPGPHRHDLQPEPIDVSGDGGPMNGDRKKPTGGKSRKPRNLAEARAVMGMPWATRQGISQAIPPAYTEWIGAQLLRAIESAA